MIKKILLCSILLSSVAFSQGEIRQLGVLVESEITESSSDLYGTVYHHDLYFVNTGASEIKVKVKRELMCSSGRWMDEQLCYGGSSGQCFSATGTLYTTPGGGATVAAGDSLLVEAKQIGDGIDGMIRAKLYMINGDDGSELDVVDVVYQLGSGSCTVGVKDEKALPSFNVYPNPANDILNISIENAQDVSISIFDIVGKEVSNMNLINGKNQLNIENLNAGVYFYSIRKNNEIIETKKLVVR